MILTESERLAEYRWSEAEIAVLDSTRETLTRWCPFTPTASQYVFLASIEPEVMYGGAAGGSKSTALLMAALQYVDVPGYAALIIRRTYAELIKPGALIDKSLSWLMPTAAKWNQQEHQWTFPGGAKLTFGYLDTEMDKFQYQSAEFNFIGVDELTQFERSRYLYLFSRLRRGVNCPVPTRMRSATNPGGIGHAWVRERFIAPHDDPDRRFISAKLQDNPHLDAKEYVKTMSNLDAVDRARLLHGDWDVVSEKSVFSIENLEKMRAHLREGRTGSIIRG